MTDEKQQPSRMHRLGGSPSFNMEFIEEVKGTSILDFMKEWQDTIEKTNLNNARAEIAETGKIQILINPEDTLRHQYNIPAFAVMYDYLMNVWDVLAGQAPKPSIDEIQRMWNNVLLKLKTMRDQTLVNLSIFEAPPEEQSNCDYILATIMIEEHPYPATFKWTLEAEDPSKVKIETLSGTVEVDKSELDKVYDEAVAKLYNIDIAENQAVTLPTMTINFKLPDTKQGMMERLEDIAQEVKTRNEDGTS